MHYYNACHLFDGRRPPDFARMASYNSSLGQLMNLDALNR
jgi:hypothetical protein